MKPQGLEVSVRHEKIKPSKTEALPNSTATVIKEISSNLTQSEDPERRRPPFLWGDEGSPDTSFQIIDGRYRLIAAHENAANLLR